MYGYRGRDARSNLHLLPTGEMIYFLAAVVVLYNSEEQSQRHYLGHTEDIKCLALHPNKMTVATGQGPSFYRREGQPHIRVWNSVSLQTIAVLGEAMITIFCHAEVKQMTRSTSSVRLEMRNRQ